MSVNGTNPSNSRSWAVFGELAWTFAPQIKVTLGGRYFEDRRRQDVNSATFGAASADSNSAKFSAFSPRFNLSWTPSDSATFYLNAPRVSAAAASIGYRQDLVLSLFLRPMIRIRSGAMNLADALDRPIIGLMPSFRSITTTGRECSPLSLRTVFPCNTSSMETI
ncbi:MAG: TonB-dependent receptor [Sphingomonadales bacterium]|nr:TonB-dependent receptor [Sphingomonadales bacterium]